jgi:BTB/POZ domain
MREGEMEGLFLKEHLSDVTLRLLDRESRELRRVPAHTLLLRIRSGYFETRLNFNEKRNKGKSDETKEKGTKEEVVDVQLPDGVTLRVFIDVVLKWCYSTDIYLGEEDDDDFASTLIAGGFALALQFWDTLYMPNFWP